MPNQGTREWCGTALTKKQRRFCSTTHRNYANLVTLNTGPGPLEPRFWRRVNKTPTCWLWTGAFYTTGYGVMRVADRNVRAHRVSWELEYGAIPPGQWVLHRCDVRACVRPDHLYLGTNADNVADMINKGRGRHGEQQRLAKLTEAQVRAMRSEYAAGGISQPALAKRYAIGLSTVQDILRRRSWKHVP